MADPTPSPVDPADPGPNLPPCGCRGGCYHVEHPAEPPQRACRRGPMGPVAADAAPVPVGVPADPERLAEAERNLRAAQTQRIDRRSVAIVMAEYDRRGVALDAARAELAEIREAFDAPPYETHTSMLALLREAVRCDEEDRMDPAEAERIAALSGLLRGMARRVGGARRWARTAQRNAHRDAAELKALLNRLGNAVGVHVGSPGRGRYDEFADRIVAAALRQRADLAELRVSSRAAAPGVTTDQRYVSHPTV